MKWIKLILPLVVFNLLFAGNAEDNINISMPGTMLKAVNYDIKIEFPVGNKTAGTLFLPEQDEIRIENCSETFEHSNISLRVLGKQRVVLKMDDGTEIIHNVRVIPGSLSLIAPLVAILLAVITREMILSLFAGIWAGVTILSGFNPVTGFFTALDTYVIQSITDSGHASIIIFSLLFGGMIGILSANGSMQGIVNSASKYASSRRRGQLATIFMGFVIFFDDYSNSMLVGNTMRPFTDKLRISREKLSYLVDSTAAPVANLAFISTWSVFQMSLLDVPFARFGITDSPYIVFLRSIPYGYYSIFALWLMIWLAFFRRDYGAMYKAEMRAMKTGKVLNDGASPLMDDSLIEGAGFGDKDSHWLNAIIPILVVITMVMTGLYVTGIRALGEGTHSFRDIIGNSDSYAALMWGAALGGFSAFGISLFKGLLNMKRGMAAWLSGVRSMLLAAIILVLAWTLGQVCEATNTAGYIISLTRDLVSPSFLPLLSFLMAAAISFSTGTSWGTMTILVPLIVPLALELTGGQTGSQVFLASFAAVLSGATFGDHCSPISDTTILSSMASGADHMDHVKTQIPYSLSAGTFAILLGFLPAGFGMINGIILGIGLAAIIGWILFIGKPWPSER